VREVRFLQQEQRRLAAILAADVAGYSRLMAADEAGTLARLKQLRAEVLEPKIVQFNGRIVGSAGDSLLVEFSSAVNAVQCAVAAQKELTDQNATLPEDRRMAFRMGVNLGDVIPDRGTIYGDGVNIAARLEKLAEPGGVCIGRSVYDQVKGKLIFTYTDQGPQQVHNIPEPVQAFRVQWIGVVSTTRPALPLPDKPSIAVLPFENMSGDREQEYFSDGITEDIITELSRWHQLTVHSRNSSFQFRGKGIDVKRVSRELGVRYLVEGSVRRMGERIRVTAQLVDGVTGNHLWAERYDRQAQEIFDVQDDVVQTIVGTLVGRVQAARVEVAKRNPPRSVAAYDVVLRGKSLPWGDARADAEARRLYETAIELDPHYGLAHALLALMLSHEWCAEMSSSNSTLERAFELAKRAVELDQNESYCQFMLGQIHLLRRSFDLAERYHRRAVEMNPSDPEHVADMGGLLAYLGKSDEAIEWLRRAKRVDPYFGPAWYWPQLGRANYIAQRFQKAIGAFETSPTMPLDTCAYLAACYADIGNPDQAQEYANRTRLHSPLFSTRIFVSKEPYKNSLHSTQLLNGLRKAGLPD
jgi:adenylate cyclase